MHLLLTALVLMSAAGSAAASPARPAPPADDFRLVFLDGDERAPVRQAARDGAAIDVGRVTAGRCSSRRCGRTVVDRRFRLRVDGGAAAGRFVRVHASVEGDAPGQRMWLDGRLLTSAAQLIDPALPLGVATAHTVQIEVSSAEPAGLIAQTITWTVEDLR